MNSSATSLNGSAAPTLCETFRIFRGNLDHTNTEAYAALAFLIALSIATCPFTILLNVLVIAAVKTQQRLKSHSNTLLGCLAVTDALVGVIAQPMFIASRILTLHGDTSDEHCTLAQLTKNVVRLCCSSSVVHLFLMSFERYLAIKYPFTYTTLVNKARVLGSSALAWITAVVATVPLVITSSKIYITINNILLVLFLASIIFCQAAVYNETRRHEKQIAAHQVSEAARQKFLKEKKALKLTTCVIVLLLLSYSPIFVVRILLLTFTITNVNIAYIIFYSASCVTMSNSLFNPIIYCVRMRQFRVAFIQMLLRKSYAQAEQFERQMFGSLNIEASQEAGPP